MYPIRSPKKALTIILIIGILGSVFLAITKTNLKSAAAFSSSSRAGIYNSSLISASSITNGIAGSAIISIDSQVSDGNNDAEERETDGFMYLNSSDLELIHDPGVMKADQDVGLRFTNVAIPKGVTIVQAYIEFQVDETSDNTTSLIFHGEAADSPTVFTNSAYNISSRPKTAASINWDKIPAWKIVGEKVQTPDLSGVIQEIVNRPGWTSGNSLVIVIDGSGRRVASSYESGPQTAALLHVSYQSVESTGTPTSLPPTATSTSIPPTVGSSPTATVLPKTSTPTSIPPTPTNTPIVTSQPNIIDRSVSSGNDDAEERVTDGYMYLTSSDLELIHDPGVMNADQHVGMRFNSIDIPRNATINQAYIEFQVDETSSEATSLVFRGEASDNAGGFTTVAYDISTRSKTNASMVWNNILPWTSVGAKVQTPDLTGVIQEIVNRQGWVSGNSLVIIVDGSGRRVASSFESGAQTAARLHLVFTPGGGTNPPPPTATSVLPTSTIPLPTATSVPPTATQVPPTTTSMPPTATATIIPSSPTQTPTSTSIPPTPTRTPLPTSSPTPGSQLTPVGQSGTWRMIFDDEFNSNVLDTNKWRTCFWWADTTCSIEPNGELELYNPEDVLVQNGVLRLRAQHRDMVAWNGVTYHYTSGMVMTGGRNGSIPPKFTFTYGFAEAKIWVPAGKGFWPAFWTLPVSYTWPPEIDIMEILGDTTNQYHMNYHYVGGNAGSTWNGPDFSAGWHIIGLDWEPTAIVWYVDGVERWRFTDQAHITNEPSYLLLNLAVGGSWPGAPDSNTKFPSYFDVDYVRVWQR